MFTTMPLSFGLPTNHSNDGFGKDLDTRVHSTRSAANRIQSYCVRDGTERIPVLQGPDVEFDAHACEV